MSGNVQTKTKTSKCWVCGKGEIFNLPWGNPLQNPQNFSLLDCLKSLRNARHKTETNFEKDYLDSMIDTLNQDELRQQQGGHV